MGWIAGTRFHGMRLKPENRRKGKCHNQLPRKAVHLGGVLILNFHFLTVISAATPKKKKRREKAMEVNPNGKPGVEPRKQSAVNFDNITATPAAKPSPNATPCIPLNLVGTDEKRVHIVRAAHGLYIPSTRHVLWIGHPSFNTKGLNFS